MPLSMTLSRVERVTLVIPAYNEEERLPKFLDALATYLDTHRDLVQAVLVVDDGSRDRTADIAMSYAKRLPGFRLLKQSTNRGKGAAIQYGVNEAKTNAVTFMDADGATPPDALPSMINALQNAPIAVGNRWSTEARAHGQTFFRALSSRALRAYMHLFGLGNVDTMCGCKAFRSEIAKRLFNPLLEERWLFDQEILFRARLLGLKIANIPIHWTSQRGSKLKPSTLLLSAVRLPIVLFRVWSILRTTPPQTSSSK